MADLWYRRERGLNWKGFFVILCFEDMDCVVVVALLRLVECFPLVLLLWIVTFQKLEDYCFKYLKPLFKFSLPTDRQTHKLRLAPSILTT